MKSSLKTLERLLARARAVGTEAADPVTAPPGFATRVIAHARIGRHRAEAAWWQLVEQRGMRVLAAAGALAVLSVIFNLGAVLQDIEQDVLAVDDPIALVADLQS